MRSARFDAILAWSGRPYFGVLPHDRTARKTLGIRTLKSEISGALENDTGGRRALQRNQ